MSKPSEIVIISALTEIPLKDLHIQYIPVCTPVDLWGHDMSLKNSPHVELMCLFLEHGNDWKRVKQTRYYTERRRRRKIGLSRWIDNKIKDHVKRRYAILRSLKKSGFRKSLRGEKPVVILRIPFWTSRFGYERDWLGGEEIWDGGGVCSAAFALGWKTIPAVYGEDRCPDSGDKGKFESKLRNVEDVWTDALSR